MKHTITLIFYFFLIPTFVYPQNYNVKIEGQFIGYNGGGKVKYSISLIDGWNRDVVIQPDSLGKFTITQSIKEKRFFHIRYNQNDTIYQCKLILEPDNDYVFVSQGRYETNEIWEELVDWRHGATSPDIYVKNNHTVEGEGFYQLHAGQIQYNLINNSYGGGLFHDEWDLYQPDNLLDTLQTRGDSQIAVFSELFEEGQIDEEFFEIAKINIGYMHAQRLIETINTTYYLEKFKINDTTITKKLYGLVPKIFELYPVEASIMDKFYMHRSYVDLYLGFLADYKDGVYKPIKRKDAAAHRQLYQNADKYLSEKAFKQYQLLKNMNNTWSLDLNSPQLAKRYLDENPEMRETEGGKLLEEVIIPRAEEFAKLSEQEFPDSIFFLDLEKSMSSFKELTDTLKGMPLLIDCWGTWCGPCRNQFHYTNKLKPFLEANGIAMVYIAFEYHTDRTKWGNFIKAYDLKGYHFIANEKFKSDFTELSGLKRYPNFVIVDSNGKIVESEAALASDGDKLYEQLKEKLIQ